jgi:hypothetical protein
MVAAVMAPITKDTPLPFYSLWEITESARMSGNHYFDLMGSHGFKVSGVVYPVRGGAFVRGVQYHARWTTAVFRATRTSGNRHCAVHYRLSGRI